MTAYKRFGNRWTVNECLQLQREFELLQLSVDEISKIHQRTPSAIMFKLDQEGFADYNILYANYAKASPKNVVNYDESENDDESVENGSEEDGSEEDGSEEDTQRLKHRVMCLEKQITSLAALILDNTYSKKNRSFLY
jgi:hypothetical protein